MGHSERHEILRVFSSWKKKYFVKSQVRQSFSAVPLQLRHVLWH